MRGRQNSEEETHTAKHKEKKGERSQHIVRGSQNNVRETHTASTMREREREASPF